MYYFYFDKLWLVIVYLDLDEFLLILSQRWLLFLIYFCYCDKMSLINLLKLIISSEN